MIAELSSPPDRLEKASPEAALDPAAAAEAKARLRDIHGEGEAHRTDRGVDQVLRLWRAEDGGADIFRELV